MSKKYLFSCVDVIELQDSFNNPPKSQSGKKLRSETPANVFFSVQLPKHLFLQPASNAKLVGEISNYGEFQNTEENRQLLNKAIKYADSVNADTVVLITPSSFTPAKPRREALLSFFENVDLGSKQLVWQPSGPWESEAAASFALEMNAILAVDPLRDQPPNGQSCYLRLGPFSVMGSRMGIYDLEQIAKTIRSFENATVVFDTDRAVDDSRNLRTVLSDGTIDDDEDDNYGDNDDYDEDDDD